MINYRMLKPRTLTIVLGIFSLITDNNVNAGLISIAFRHLVIQLK